MGGAPWQIDGLRIAGLVAAALLAAAGTWALWVGRSPDEDERVVIPLVGRVSVPTCLTLALCCLALGYHLVAYCLAPKVELLAVPIDRWWIVVAVVLAGAAGSLALDRLESRTGGE